MACVCGHDRDEHDAETEECGGVDTVEGVEEPCDCLEYEDEDADEDDDRDDD